MRKPNLDKIIADNLNKTRNVPKIAPATLPKDGWLNQYTNGGVYLSDKAKATQFGQYKKGGGYFPEYHSWAPPREAAGGLIKAGDGLERKINKLLGNPMGRAELAAENEDKWFNPKTKQWQQEDPIDNFRHPMAGRYTAEAIANKFPKVMQYSGIPQVAGFLGSTALGLGHELANNKYTLPADEYPNYSLGQVLREAGEDAFNNMVGAGVGVLPFVSPKQKTDILRYLSDNNLIPDGIGRGSMYFKKRAYGGLVKAKNGTNVEYVSNPNNYRLKAYQDSLQTYNSAQYINNYIKQNKEKIFGKNIVPYHDKYAIKFNPFSETPIVSRSEGDRMYQEYQNILRNASDYMHSQPYDSEVHNEKYDYLHYNSPQHKKGLKFTNTAHISNQQYYFPKPVHLIEYRPERKSISKGKSKIKQKEVENTFDRTKEEIAPIESISPRSVISNTTPGNYTLPFKPVSQGEYTISTSDGAYRVPNKAMFDLITKRANFVDSHENDYNRIAGATVGMSNDDWARFSPYLQKLQSKAYGGDISIPDLQEGNWLAKYDEGGPHGIFGIMLDNAKRIKSLFNKKPTVKSTPKGKAIKYSKQYGNDYVDLQKDYGVDPFSKIGIETAKEISAANPNIRFVCTAEGCSQIATSVAATYGNYFDKGNAWDLGNKNKVVATNPDYEGQIGKGILHDPTSYSSPESVWGYPGAIIGLNRPNTSSSEEYADQELYPGSRGYEHVGYMLDKNTMLHGTGPSKGFLEKTFAGHPAYYVIDRDISDGLSLSGYGKYQPVEAIEPSVKGRVKGTVKSLLGKQEYGGWLDKYQTAGTVSESTGVRKIIPNQEFITDKQALQQLFAQEQAKQKEQQISKVKPQGKVARAWDIASHPGTAIRALNTQGYIPKNLGKGETALIDYALDTVNPAFYANTIGSAVRRTAKNIVNPQTYTDLLKTTGYIGQKIIGEPISSDYKQSAYNTLGRTMDAAIAIPVAGEITAGAKTLSNLAPKYLTDLVASSKAAGTFKLPTYKNLYRWQPDKYPGWLLDASMRTLTPEQQALTGSWYTYTPKDLPFYMQTRPGPGYINRLRFSDQEIKQLEENMSSYAKGMSGKEYSIPESNISKFGEVTIPPVLRTKASKTRFDINPAEVPVSESFLNKKLKEYSDIYGDPRKDFPDITQSPFYEEVLKENAFKEAGKKMSKYSKSYLGIPRKYFPFKKGGQTKGWLDKHI